MNDDLCYASVGELQKLVRASDISPVEILASKKPRFRYLVGPQARNTSRLRWLLPEALYENGKRKVFRLDG